MVGVLMCCFAVWLKLLSVLCFVFVFFCAWLGGDLVVMLIVDCSSGWLVDGSMLVDWLVGCLVDCWIGRYLLLLGCVVNLDEWLMC